MFLGYNFIVCYELFIGGRLRLQSALLCCAKAAAPAL